MKVFRNRHGNERVELPESRHRFSSLIIEQSDLFPRRLWISDAALTKKEVSGIIKHLQAWCDTGSLEVQDG